MTGRPNAYVICTSPRSGSTLLCNLLAATGCAGLPDSHFHVPDLSAWQRSHGLDPDTFASETEALKAVFAAAMRRGTGQTGMFGLRLQRDSFAYFMEQLARLHPGLASDRERIEAAFGRTHFLHLTRADKLDQAISLVRARQSGLWHRAPDGTEIERDGPGQPPVFDRAGLTANMHDLEQKDDDWRDWFRAQGITPQTITYDTLAADPAATLAAILDRLGIDPARASSVTPGVARLADSTNRDWKARYLSHDP